MPTQAQIDALVAAIASGARRVKYPDGSEIEYRTLADMRSILSDWQAQLAGTAGANAGGRSVLVSF